MRKFLLIVAMMLALPSFAQENTNLSVMTTTYDLQSNGFLSNRMYQNSDGNVAIVAMMSNSLYDATFPDRGTGYNFFDGNAWGENPTSRVEANATGEDMRTGWPSIAPYGAEGEILVNHTDGLNYWIREKAGEGVWDGPHAIPNPTDIDEVVGGIYNALTWARIVTTGENNDVLHIFAAAQGDETTAQYYLRTSDLQNWDIQFAPLEMDDLHIGIYAADDYAVSANGDNIAVVYCTGFGSHVMLYESNDAGLTWESRMVWESPIHGLDWETDENSLFEKLYGPTHVSVAIGKDGVSHVALSVGLYDHKNLGWSYSIYAGLLTDGVAYWNDTTKYKGVLGPIRSSQDDDLKNALRLWWPDEYNSGAVTMDPTNFCAWMPPHKDAGYAYFDNKKQYVGVNNGTAGDYLTLFGLVAYPSIAVDPAGNLAVAYSAPDVNRTLFNEEYLWNNQYYMRSIFVNYKPVEATSWLQMPVSGNKLYADDFANTSNEATNVSAVSTPANENEFWFSCLTDEMPGFYTGTSSDQADITTSSVDVFRYVPNYNVKIIAQDIINGSVTGNGTYPNGDNVTLTAIPDEGYRFLNWTENGRVVSMDAEYSFVAAIDRVLVANFLQDGYNMVTTFVNPKGTGTVEGSGAYETNENVTLKAVPGLGYEFVNWTEGGEVVSEDAEYSFVITTDRYLVANFRLTKHDVVVTMNPENAGIITGEGTYEYNQTVTLKVSALDGYRFACWSEGEEVLSEEDEYSFVITEDRNIVANFKKLYNVTITINPENAGTAEGAGIYEGGETLKVIAKANKDYKFVKWTDAGGELLSENPDYSFVVTGDMELVANFMSTEGVEELTSLFKIYPNPVDDKLYIESENEVKEIVVYDVYGRQQVAVDGQQTSCINVANLNSGVYFVKVVTDNGEVVKRFVKE